MQPSIENLELSIELSQTGQGRLMETPRLLLHCCCAPCASYVIEHLLPHFTISLYFYNPNIQPLDEYGKRAAELRKLLEAAKYGDNVELIICDYCDSFDEIAAMYPDEPEGGRRCRVCFELRLAETARYAKAGGFDFFTTTLSVSPHKDAALINDLGGKLAEAHGIKFLHSNFKKQDGYKRSVELSKQYGLYRQTYCGCQDVSFSK